MYNISLIDNLRATTVILSAGHATLYRLVLQNSAPVPFCTSYQVQQASYGLWTHLHVAYCCEHANIAQIRMIQYSVNRNYPNWLRGQEQE